MVVGAVEVGAVSLASSLPRQVSAGDTFCKIWWEARTLQYLTSSGGGRIGVGVDRIRHH